MTAARSKLPPRRQHVTEKVAMPAGPGEPPRSFHLSVGLDPDTARAADIWIDGPKAGSHEQQAPHDAAAVVSVALQHDVPAAVLAAACDRPRVGAVTISARDADAAPRSVLAAALDRAAGIEAEGLGRAIYGAVTPEQETTS